MRHHRLARGTRRLLAACALGALAVGLPAAAGAPAAGERPRAVVLLIGDGLGVSQITLTRLLARGEGERLALESLPVLGLVSTWSASNPVTDSGAAATAMASGIKTGNQFVGMDEAGTAVRSLTEEAKERGWRVGYVTTTTLTHATPAGFYAHVPNRYADVAQIAEQLLEHGPDVALGGGLADFLPDSEAGIRRDRRNLVEEARAAGYTVLTRGDPRPAAPPARLLGLFAWGHLAYALDDRRLPPERRDPALADLTAMALATLGRDGAPFFLMVEGGRIDHAGHSFDAAGVVAETVEFDRAVEAVLDYQRRHPDVLVLLTADHATGGLAINDFVDWEALRRQRASVDWMTAQIRNAGAGAELVAEMTGFTDIADADLDPIRTDFDSYEAARRLGRLLADRHGVTWIPRVDATDTKGHTGEDVPLYAGGPGAGRFAGVLDNAEIPGRLREVLGW